MPSILIVDDERGLLTSLVMAFETHGYRSAGAASAAEALDLLRGIPFDVILTDLVMPGMDGLSLMDRVHADFPDMVIILMTGGATVESAVRALKGGESDYVVKPFRVAEIFHVVEAVPRAARAAARKPPVVRAESSAAGAGSVEVQPSVCRQP
jgi:DNA-binding NtrC family response regulator